MGGTLNSIYNSVSFALQTHTEAMARLQEQASTGSRINRSSDDPSSAYRVLTLKSRQRSLEKYMEHIDETASTLEMSLNVVQNMADRLAQEKVRLTQIISGTYTQEARDRISEGVNDALEQLVSLANTRHMEQYLFGGTSTSSAPYQVQRTNGKITAVNYVGSKENRKIEVAPGVDYTGLNVGDDVFRSQNRSAPVFLGGTGAKAGTGTSSVRGDVWLTVTDKNNDGTFELSIDDGLTSVDADGTANQALVDSRTGKVLYVDTTAIAQTGTEMVRVPGTYDAFNTLISLRDLLSNQKGLSEAQMDKYRSAAVDSLEEVRSLLVQESVSMGSKVQFLDNLKTSLEDMKFDTSDAASTLQDADVTQIAIDLSRREVLYQMSLSVAGKLLSVSLLDFI